MFNWKHVKRTRSDSSPSSCTSKGGAWPRCSEKVKVSPRCNHSATRNCSRLPAMINSAKYLSAPQKSNSQMCARLLKEPAWDKLRKTCTKWTAKDNSNAPCSSMGMARIHCQVSHLTNNFLARVASHSWTMPASWGHQTTRKVSLIRTPRTNLKITHLLLSLRKIWTHTRIGSSLRRLRTSWSTRKMAASSPSRARKSYRTPQRSEWNKMIGRKCSITRRLPWDPWMKFMASCTSKKHFRKVDLRLLSVLIRSWHKVSTVRRSFPRLNLIEVAKRCNPLPINQMKSSTTLESCQEPKT